VPAAQPLARKRGFTVPVGDWIARRGAQLGPMVARQPGVREICLPDAVEELFRAAPARHTGFAAWTLLFYALWHRHPRCCVRSARAVSVLALWRELPGECLASPEGAHRPGARGNLDRHGPC